MYSKPNTETLQGRMLEGLLASTNRKARMLLTVELRGQRHYQQTFRAKAWTGRDGNRMLTLDLNDGDWAAGTHATKVLHVDTTQGRIAAARGMGDQLVVYAATAAVRWAFTGEAPQPSNGTVDVTAAQLCGCCGAELTHPVSKDLGIGPECAKKLGLEHHYRGTTLTSARKGGVAKAKAKQGAAPAAPAPAVDVDGLLAEATELYQDELAVLDADERAHWVQHARAALAAGTHPQRPGVAGDDPRARCEHGAVGSYCSWCERAGDPGPSGTGQRDLDAELAQQVPVDRDAAEAHRAMGIEAPHRTCMGLGCKECQGTGLVSYDVAHVASDTTVLSLASCAAAAVRAAKLIAAATSQERAERHADELDAAMGAFTGDLHEATAMAAAS